MKTATISQSTRKYLEALGKFNDAYSDLFDATADQFGYDGAGDVLKPVAVHYHGLQDEIYKILGEHITDNMSTVTSTEI